MEILKLFEDYIKLNYVGQKQKELPEKDLKIDNITIIRSKYLGYTIYYLNNGSSLFIPREWFDIFKGLYENNSKQILFNKPTNKVEEFIQKMVLLFTRKPDLSFLDTLGDICIIGTTDIRQVLNNLEINIKPFEFKSIGKNFEI